MSIDTVSAILGWSLLINLGFYLVTVVAVLVCRDWVVRLQTRMFALDTATVTAALYRYIATFKLLLIVFNFSPWIAVQIVR